MATRILALAAAVAVAVPVGWGADSKPDSSSLASGVKLDNVVVYGRRSNFGLQSSQMSATDLSKSQIMSAPVFMGEPDVLKTIQKLPGVQSDADGMASIYVRGGDYDQNYITLDGSALYNAEHVKGFVSAINPDVVERVNFYRGAFPARYGSRLSSVIDVGIKPGDFERYHGSLSLGMLAGRIQAEGPVWKGRTSFNVAARMSYINLIAKPLLKKVYDQPDALRPYQDMGFYDINAKVVHRFNSSHSLSAVYYFGHDDDSGSPTSSRSLSDNLDNPRFDPVRRYRMDEQRASSTTNSWLNSVASVYWTAVFSPRLSLNTNLSYSRYRYRLAYSNMVATQIDTTTGACMTIASRCIHATAPTSATTPSRPTPPSALARPTR